MTDVLMLCSAPDLARGSRVRREASTLAAAGYDIHLLATSPTEVRLSDESARFQVIHVHDPEGLEPGSEVCRRTGAKLVYETPDIRCSFDGPPEGPSKEDLRRGEVERRYIGRADLVIAGTDAATEFLRARYGLARVHTVGNTPSVEPAAWREDIRAAAGLEPRIRVLAHLGELNPSRGRSALLGAVAALPDTALVVIGGGDSEADLRATAETEGVSARVVSLATRSSEEAVRLCADADIAVCLTLPVSESRRCSLPVRLFEYAAAGIPILGSDIPEVERRIREYALGEVVDGDSPESVERGISRLLSEPDCREEAAAGAARLREHENRPLEGRALVQLYRELCEPGSGVS